MADRIIFFQGTPEDVFGEHAAPPDMVEDLRQIASVPVERLEAFARALESEPGFASDKRLRELVEEHLGSAKLFEPVGRAVGNLKPEKVGEIIDRLEKWRASSEENGKRLAQADIEQLRSGLPKLIRQYPAVVRQKKASRAGRALGKRVTDIDILSDLRPIFSDVNDAVDGLITVTTLKIEYANDRGEEEKLEVVITADLLKKLSEKAQAARKSLDTLAEAAPKWVPNGLSDVE